MTLNLISGFLNRTPDDLVKGGLYNDLAVALFPSHEETSVAIAQLYMKMAQMERAGVMTLLATATVADVTGSHPGRAGL